MKKLLALLISPILFLHNTGLAEDNSSPEKALLSSAIKIYSSISPDEDVKSRIAKSALTIKKIDKIIESYSDTDTGLELLSTGSFGKFNIEKIRKTYLSELIDFNLKTCGSIPSFNCLGYVSLDNGNKKCNNASSFSQYLSASNNFRNAYRIFKSQGDSVNTELVVLSAYRNCANSARSSFGKDYINSRLINVMLDSGDESKAVGLTQNMKTPLFKILAAADIRVYKGKYDYATFNKLVEKSNTLASKSDKESALINLANKLYSVNLDPLSNSADFKLTPTIGGSSSCDEKEKYLSEIAMDFLFNKAKSKFANQRSNEYTTINRIKSQTQKCDTYNLTPITFFLEDGDVETAANIRDFQSNRGINQNLMASHLTNTLNKDDVIRYYNKLNNDFESWKKFNADSYGFNNRNLTADRERKLYPFGNNFGKNAVFKSMIDGNEVCSASNILFKDLRGTKYEAEAVTYFISSPIISSDKKYECGDADLDLLLN